MKYPSSIFNSSIARFWFKLALLTSLVLFTWIAGTRAFGFPDAPVALAAISHAFETPADVLYLGDSTTFRFQPSDDDQRAMAEMLADLMPETRIVDIVGAGFRLRVFEGIVHYGSKQGSLPKAIVVPINLRSFSPVWDAYPAMQFESLLLHLQHPSPLARSLYRPLAVFKTFDLTPISSSEFADRVDAISGDGAGGQRPPMAIMYTTPIDPQHRLLQAMERLVTAARRGGAHVVFYVTPVDVTLGKKVIGAEFSSGIKENLSIIHDLSDQLDVPLIDLSQSLPSERFPESGSKNEHLDDIGRRFVAQEVQRFLIDSGLFE
jgi:hypothetical protein